MLKLKHETELVEAEKKGKEDALRQFNSLAKEVSVSRLYIQNHDVLLPHQLEITYQLRIDDLNAAHAHELDSLQSQLLAAVAQSIELRTTAALPTPLPTAPTSAAATRTQSHFTASAAGTHVRDPRSPTASTGPVTNGSVPNPLANNSSTPSLRVVSAIPSSNPELDEKLHSIEELLSQRKDALLKRLQDNEPPRSADLHNQTHTPS